MSKVLWSLALLLAAPAAASPEQEADLFFQALAHDRSLSQRAGEVITIAVLFNPENPDSAAAKQQLLEALQARAKKGLGDRTVSVVELSYGGPARLIAAMRARHVAALYVTPGMGRELKAIMAVSRATSATTLAGETGYVQQGLSLGIGVKGDALVINVAATRAEGMDLDLPALAGAETL